ncbi:MAG: sulfatase-like hydrolase/transferase [Acidobacteria bacterium]|nr:sulfatase-like hydrolase/transferase [Acidobacteriota bacterium]
MRAAAGVLVAGILAAGCHRAPARTSFPGTPIVLISIDTLRSDHLPAYGYRGVATPAIDALRRDALLFERVYSHYPMTLPSHVSLLSGELPPVTGVRDNSGFLFDSSRHSFLPRLLGQAGYDTGAVVSTSVLAGSTGLAGGFDFYDDRMPAAADLSEQAKRPGAESARVALDWVRRRAAGHPFFLFLHLYEPHAPYRPPEPFASRYRESPYDGEIADADAVVGGFLGELRRLGIYDRAVVALLSDHGEGLGEHGELQHGMFLYRETLQVPLLLKLPGSRLGGGSVPAPAQLIDVAPTLLRLAGRPVPAGLSGENLLDLARSQAAGATPSADAADAAHAQGADLAGGRPIYSETLGPRLHYGYSELTSLIEGRLHLADGPEPELYDLAADPKETRNRLAGERRSFAAMRRTIRGIYRPPAPPRPADAETARKLAALGYVAASGALATGPLPDPRGRRAELAILDAALQAIQEQRFAAAVPLLERLLGINPRMPDVHILLATTFEHLGRNQEAAASYRRAVAAAGGSPVTAYVAALGLLKLGRLDEAQAFAELARGGAGGDGLGGGVDGASIAALAVEIALARNDLDAALGALRRLDASPAGPPGAHGPQGSPGPPAAGTQAAGTQAAALRRAVGSRLADAGRPQEALALLEPLASGGDAATLDAIAVALSDAGRDQEAQGIVERVLAAAPRDARAHQILGTLALHREQPVEARRQLQLAVELDPRLAIAWNTLGVARLRLESPGAALDAWRKAVAIAPDYWEALYNIGLVSAAMGRKAEARQALERFVSKAPPNLFGPDLAKARSLLQELGG